MEAQDQTQTMTSLLTQMEADMDRIEAAFQNRPASIPGDIEPANQNLTQQIKVLEEENQALRNKQANLSEKIDTTVLRLQTLIGSEAS